MNDSARLIPSYHDMRRANNAREHKIFHKGVRNVLVLQAIALAVLIFALTLAFSGEPGEPESSSRPVVTAGQQ